MNKNKVFFFSSLRRKTNFTLLRPLGFIYITLASSLTGLVGCMSTTEKNISEHSTVMPSGSNKDEWKTVGYGGGGAMFYPEVSPFNPDYAFVSCDMTGSYVTHDGGQSWRMFNLHAPTKFYVFDPLDSNTVYAKSIGLFKSSDRGKTWNLFYPSPSETTGLVAKGDHAQEQIITRDSTIRDVQAFAIDPENSKKLFTVISVDKLTALYVSDDGGVNWQKEKDLQEDAQNIFIVPSSPKDNRTIYIAQNNGITVRDNGKWTFNKSPEGVHQLMHFTAGFNESNNKFIVYAISGKSYFDPKGTISGIFYSENGGASWENRQQGLTSFNMKGSEPPEWRTIATSYSHPEVVYVSYNGMKANNDTSFIGVAKSIDFGKTWVLAWKDVIKKDGNVPSENLNGGWIDERFGPTWGENPFSIAVSPVNPDVCYTTDFGRAIKTSNGGKTWEQVYTNKKEGGGWISRGLEVTTGYQVVYDPFDKNQVFICNTDIGLMKSTDGGQSWQSITKNNGVPRKWQNSTYWLALDPEVKGRAWAAMSDVHDLPRPKMFRRVKVKDFKGGILQTEDGGNTWKIVSEDIGEGAMTHILIDPSGNKELRTLYACAFGKGVYKSTDGGKTWKKKNNGISGDEPFTWRISRRNKDGVLFLVINRRSEDGSIGNTGDGALYRSDDGAETWKPVKLPAETNGPMSLIPDEENMGTLLLGAWGRYTKGKLTPDIGGGIFISHDDGSTWTPVLQKDQHIHDISYDPRNKIYYACGFNGSAYRSEDIGQTWKRIKGYDFKWGKRVDIDPLDPDKIFIITFGGGVWHGPANVVTDTENNVSIEQIITHGY